MAEGTEREQGLSNVAPNPPPPSLVSFEWKLCKGRGAGAGETLVIHEFRPMFERGAKPMAGTARASALAGSGPAARGKGRP